MHSYTSLQRQFKLKKNKTKLGWKRSETIKCKANDKAGKSSNTEANS